MLVLVCGPISNSYSNKSDFARQLRERNIWRAVVAYPAAGFVFLEAVEFFVSNYQLNAKFLTVAVILSNGRTAMVMSAEGLRSMRPALEGSAVATQYQPPAISVSPVISA